MIINNQNLSFYKLDISDKNSVNTFYNDLNKIDGDIFALINAAGFQSPIGKFIDIDYNDWIINLSNNFLSFPYRLFGWARLQKCSHRTINFPVFNWYSLSSNRSISGLISLNTL